jgi:hypothetical protein
MYSPQNNKVINISTLSSHTVHIEQLCINTLSTFISFSRCTHHGKAAKRAGMGRRL